MLFKYETVQPPVVATLEWRPLFGSVPELNWTKLVLCKDFSVTVKSHSILEKATNPTNIGDNSSHANAFAAQVNKEFDGYANDYNFFCECLLIGLCNCYRRQWEFLHAIGCRLILLS